MTDTPRLPGVPADRAAGSDQRSGSVPPGGLVLVAGASGYIGGRLVAELLAAGYRVRCLVRTRAKITSAAWSGDVEIVVGDVNEPLRGALDDVDAAYYLVHAIGSTADWVSRDRQGAENFGRSAADARVRRIVYLGGLGEDVDGEAHGSSDELSAHLASRHEVGRALGAAGVPVTELRAAVIIGSGSASFEMLRYLVEVLPAMVTPRWVETRCQPIGVRDVLRYLVEVLADDSTLGETYDIGGADVLTYREMMTVYAEEAKLRRRIIIPVPVLSPRLSSLWVGLVTPLPTSLARPLVDSLVNEVVVHDDRITKVLPGPLSSYRAAVRLALGRVAAGTVETNWAGAELGGRPADPMPTDPDWAGGTVLSDRRTRPVAASATDAYRVITAVGGRHGWYGSEWMWGIRGVIDKLVGGPGMRRGRRVQGDLRVGDALDFWRVEALEPARLVRLRAEMRTPGAAWLEWRIIPDGGGDGDGGPDVGPGDVKRGCTIEQTARFHPRGLWSFGSERGVSG